MLDELFEGVALDSRSQFMALDDNTQFMAQDAGEKWITIRPDGASKGKHVLIDKNGTVKGGAGGSLNGKKLTKAKSVPLSQLKQKSSGDIKITHATEAGKKRVAEGAKELGKLMGKWKRAKTVAAKKSEQAKPKETAARKNSVTNAASEEKPATPERIEWRTATGKQKAQAVNRSFELFYGSATKEKKARAERMLKAVEQAKTSFDAVQVIGKAKINIMDGTGSLPFGATRGIYIAIARLVNKFPALIDSHVLVEQREKEGQRQPYASASMGWEKRMVMSVNPKHFSKGGQYLTRSVRGDIATGYHPKGTGIDGSIHIMTHETGHCLEDLLWCPARRVILGNRIDPTRISENLYKYGLSERVRKLVDKRIGNYNVASEVSRYACKNNREWFAECFTELMLSPNPRRVAREFGKVIEKVANGDYSEVLAGG